MHSQSRQRRARYAVRSALLAAALVAAAGFGQQAHAIRFWGSEENAPAEQQPPQQPAAPAAQAAPAAGGAVASVGGLPNFADLAEQLRPAVVNISTVATGDSPQGTGPGQGPAPRQFGGLEVNPGSGSFREGNETGDGSRHLGELEAAPEIPLTGDEAGVETVGTGLGPRATRERQNRDGGKDQREEWERAEAAVLGLDSSGPSGEWNQGLHDFEGAFMRCRVRCNGAALMTIS